MYATSWATSGKVNAHILGTSGNVDVHSIMGVIRLNMCMSSWETSGRVHVHDMENIS